jgi:two-component sensor histidine kinase
MLQLQSAGSASKALRQALLEASSRIAAIARAHQRLHKSDGINTLDLGAYLSDICKDLSQAMPASEVNMAFEQGIEIPTDQAISAALLVNELVTNVAKYAYPDGPCRVWITLARGAGNSLDISVRDEGVGLPSTFDIKSGLGLGMRIADAFTRQLHGKLDIIRRNPGTELVLSFPATPAG